MGGVCGGGVHKRRREKEKESICVEKKEIKINMLSSTGMYSR